MITLKVFVFIIYIIIDKNCKFFTFCNFFQKILHSKFYGILISPSTTFFFKILANLGIFFSITNSISFYLIFK